MKDKYKDKDDTNIYEPENEQDALKTHRRAGIAVVLIVLALVTVISCVVFAVELYFGKTAGTVSLVILALIIAGYLYRDEIKEKLKRK